MPTARRRSLRSTLLITALALTAACGTTVPLAGTALDPSVGAPAGTDGLAVPGTAPDGTGVAGGPTAPAGRTGGGTALPVGRAAVPSRSTAGAAAPTTAGPVGVTATTVDIGYLHFASAPLAVLGSTDGDQSFHPDLYRFLAEEVNARGGVLGRKVRTVGYALDVSNTAVSETEQKPCEHFTQDAKVFAVLWSFYGSTLTPCLNAAGVAQIGNPYAAAPYVDRAVLQRNAFYAPGVAVTEDYVRSLVTRLKAQDYFTGWDTTAGAPGSAPVKVGVLSFSDDSLAHHGRRLRAELAAIGHPVADTSFYEYDGNLESQSSAIPNALLRFRQSGVTHVMGTAVNGLVLQAFRTQGYFPRLGLDTSNGLRATAQASTDQASRRILNGAVAIGSLPAKDVLDPPVVSPAQTRCEKLMEKNGFDYRATPDRHYNVLVVCESFWSLIAAIEKGGALTPAALRTGFGALGTRESTIALRSTWSPERLASAAVVADLRYDAGCTCFRYTGTRTPL